MGTRCLLHLRTEASERHALHEPSLGDDTHSRVWVFQGERGSRALPAPNTQTTHLHVHDHPDTHLPAVKEKVEQHALRHPRGTEGGAP